MKALKEKRIRLRSLWRRGLVILSLFALVFASCNSSGGDEKETDPETTLEDRNAINVIVKGNLAKQYEGVEIDLSGITVEVTYLNNGATDTVTLDTPDKIKAYFKVTPKYAQGIIMEDYTDQKVIWMPVTEYVLSWKPSTGADVKVWEGVAVVPIQRQYSVGTGNSTFAMAPISGLFSTGSNSLSNGFTNQNWVTVYELPKLSDRYVTNGTINFTSDLTFLNEGVYVDDPALETIQKSTNFKLQATYVDLVDKDIELDNTFARFVTFYNPKDHNATAPGELLVTINTNATDSKSIANAKKALGTASFAFGQHFDSDTIGVASINSKTEGMLTAMRYIPKVYHVQEVKVVGTTVEDLALDNDLWMGYWESEGDYASDRGSVSTALWTEKLIAAGAKLQITYSNEVEKEPVLLSELLKRNTVVWYNPLLFNSGSNKTNETEYAPWEVFGVQGVTEVAAQAKRDTKIKNTNWDKLYGQYAADPERYPAIRLEYRGVQSNELPVDIVNSLTEFTVVGYKDGSELAEAPHMVDMIWGRRPIDNDVGKLKPPKWDQIKFGREVETSVKLTSVRGKELVWKDLGPVWAYDDTSSKAGGLTVALSNYSGTDYYDTYNNATKDLSAAAKTEYFFNLGLKGFTTNFGLSGAFTDSDANPIFNPAEPSINWKWTNALWGISGIQKNGPATEEGAVKSITFYYAPPANINSTVSGKVTNKLMKANIEASFKNIGTWEYYTGQGR